MDLYKLISIIIKKGVAKMLKKKHKVEFRDCDFASRLRMDVLFDLFASIATQDAFLTGIYREDMYGKYGWIVTKQTLKLYEDIRLGDEITITTVFKKPSIVIFPRYYAIEKEGRCIGECFSQWTLIDLNSRHIARPKTIHLEIPELTEKMMPPVRLTPLNQPTDYTYDVRYSDIDMNGHLNNTQYIRIAYDLLDLSYLKNHRLCELSINYEKEVPPCTQLALSLVKEDNTYHIEGKQEESCFLIQLSFKEGVV